MEGTPGKEGSAWTSWKCIGRLTSNSICSLFPFASPFTFVPLDTVSSYLSSSPPFFFGAPSSPFLPLLVVRSWGLLFWLLQHWRIAMIRKRKAKEGSISLTVSECAWMCADLKSSLHLLFWVLPPSNRVSSAIGAQHWKKVYLPACPRSDGVTRGLRISLITIEKPL